MSKDFASKRKFGKTIYDLYIHFDTKREAEQYAKGLRKSGRNVRIVPSTMTGGRRVYLLYTAFK